MDPATSTIFGTSVATAISRYGYIALYPLFVIEGQIVGFISGILISLGVLEAIPVFILYVLGTVTSDLVLYFSARYSDNWLQYMPFTSKVMTRKNAVLENRDATWVNNLEDNYFSFMMFGKIAPVPWLAEAVAVTAGTVKMNIKKVCVPILIGQPIWSAAIIALGYFFGDVITDPQKLLTEAGIVTAGVVLLLGGYFYLAHHRVKQYVSDRGFFMRNGEPDETV